MKRAKFDPDSDQQQRSPAGPDHSLLCRVHGCGRRWSVDINHGKVCSFHDEGLTRADFRRPMVKAPAKSAIPVPFHDAVKPFCEPVEDDREAA